MTAQEMINQKYTNLCTQLGDLSLKKAELDARISVISAQISALNTLAPDVVAMEKSLKDTNVKISQTTEGDS